MISGRYSYTFAKRTRLGEESEGGTKFAMVYGVVKQVI
jgi:hypothetical protein